MQAERKCQRGMAIVSRTGDASDFAALRLGMARG